MKPARPLPLCLALPTEHAQRAVIVIDGALSVAGETITPGELVVFQPDVELELTASGSTHAVLLGGAPLDAPRYLYWNYVASDPGRIEQAKRDWNEGKFGRVEGDPEFIPLPERRNTVKLESA